MSKLQIEFEITGLKLRIAGESDDVATKAAAVQRQFQGVIQAIGAIADGANGALHMEGPQNAAATAKVIETAAQPSTSSASRGKPGRPKTNSGVARTAAEPIDLKHDAQSFGFPKQEWNTATKPMWLLYILVHEAGQNEASARSLAATFNKYFREFGRILHNNITRDLSGLRAKSRYVNNDPNKDPQTLYLLEDGKKEIERLLANPAAPTASSN